ncbi:MAG: helix-turn-helix transcriptional regulator [Lachnospiraceae bacterium]|nr:helix-turn-helix transcriptional regulator [Lachnospiraceae bacterium]
MLLQELAKTDIDRAHCLVKRSMGIADNDNTYDIKRFYKTALYLLESRATVEELEKLPQIPVQQNTDDEIDVLKDQIWQRIDKEHLTGSNNPPGKDVESVLRKNLSESLKYYRKEAGMTQAELGKILGKSENTVASWEQGLSNPSATTLYRISKIFRIPMDHMVERTV